MSAAAAADAAPPAPKGKKKLIIIIAVVLVLLLGGGGAAFFMMKKKAAEAAAAAAAAEGEEAPAAKAHGADTKHDAAHPPVFMPLEPFVVNLADKDADRYAQIGITLEVEDQKFADQMKAYMPAIRNGILMVLAHKTSQELLERSGKEALAKEILREAVRPMGIEVEDEDEEGAHGKADEEKPKGKKKKKKAPPPNPVKAVNFSNFIIQ